MRVDGADARPAGRSVACVARPREAEGGASMRPCLSKIQICASIAASSGASATESRSPATGTVASAAAARACARP